MELSAKDLHRFLSKIAALPNGCWEWQGAKTKGYGEFNLSGKPVQCHRLCFSICKSDDITDKELHHQCKNPWCVNPDHLKPVTRREHIALTPASSAFTSITTNFCINGHQFTQENTRWTREGTKRTCRECQRQWNLSYWHEGELKKSPYRGVRWDRRSSKWVAVIGHNYHTIYIGKFEDEGEAAKAYNLKAIELKGVGAHLNVVSQSLP